MAVLLQVLLIIHVMAAMLWFGGATFMPRRLRDLIACERSEARKQLPAMAAHGKLLAAAGTLVLLTGLLLAVLRPGGFGALPVRFHIALLLTLVWWGVGIFVVRPTYGSVGAVLAGDGDLEPARAASRRAGMLAGLQHGLFTAIVVLMLWRL